MKWKNKDLFHRHFSVHSGLFFNNENNYLQNLRLQCFFNDFQKVVTQRSSLCEKLLQLLQLNDRK